MATTTTNSTQLLLPVGTQVLVQDKLRGQVCGHGFQASPNAGEPLRAVYLIKLEKGFYAEGVEPRLFVSVVPADPSNVREWSR